MAEISDEIINGQLVPVIRHIEISKSSCLSNWTGYDCVVEFDERDTLLAVSAPYLSYSKTYKVSVTEKVVFDLTVKPHGYQVIAYAGSLGRSTIRTYLRRALNHFPSHFKFKGIKIESGEKFP